MEFWRKALAGLLIGLGCVMPGVSGGVMAVSFGLYKPMLDAVTGLWKDWRGGARYLSPLALGGAAGYLLGAVGLAAFLRRDAGTLLCLLIGLMLGGVPGLLRQANAGGFHPRYLGALALGLAASLALGALPKADAPLETLGFARALAAGAIQGVGTVVPGVSGSFVLIYLGWYQALLDAAAGMRLATLAPAALGFALACLMCLEAVKRLFDRHPAWAHYGALGFLLGSAALIVPPLGAGAALAAQILAAAVGVAIALRMGRLEASGGGA